MLGVVPNALHSRNSRTVIIPNTFVLNTFVLIYSNCKCTYWPDIVIQLIDIQIMIIELVLYSVYADLLRWFVRYSCEQLL